MSTVTLDSPAEVLSRLSAIERDLAVRQNGYEAAARDWYEAQREMRREHARALLGSPKASVTEKKAEADLAADSCDGAKFEADYEALKAVIRVLEQRASICQSILRSQSHMGP